MAVTITFDDSRIGDTLADNGRLNSITFVDPPSQFGAGLFRLIDRDSSGCERQIHCENFDHSLAIRRSNAALIAGGYPLLAKADIRFTKLLATAIPPGATFELVVSPPLASRLTKRLRIRE
jgi:hypothetical protein